MEIAAPIIIILFLTFSSSFFSASETALFSLPLTKIRAYQTNPDAKKRLISKLVLEPRDLLVTVFMMNTFVNLLLQNTVSHLVGETASWVLKVGVPFIIMLIFGEIIPKYVGLKNNVEISNVVAPSINYLQNLLKPIRRIIISITTPVSHALFFYLRKEKEISKDELKHVLKTSQEHGVLHPDEAELIWGYLNLQDAAVKELMRPRDDILFYDANDPLSKLIYLFVDQECSRLPVCENSIDNVLGIITARQFFLHRHTLDSSQQILPFLAKPLYVPETTPARLLLRRFDESGQVLALVVDEYGSISGLITREDLVEVVVGDITDLRDTKDLYTTAGKYEIITNGRLELSEFNHLFDVSLTSKNNLLTIGGWLIEELGDIPKTGTKVEIHNMLFQVLAADPNRIRRLYIRKLNSKLPKQKAKEGL
jgi:putative hemolysin